MSGQIRHRRSNTWASPPEHPGGDAHVTRSVDWIYLISGIAPVFRRAFNFA